MLVAYVFFVGHVSMVHTSPVVDTKRRTSGQTRLTQSDLVFLCTLAEGPQKVSQRPFTKKVFEDDFLEVGDS
ncbi:hypothetical protein BDR22DRAFT_860455 [Usnea florida]